MDFQRKLSACVLLCGMAMPIGCSGGGGGTGKLAGDGGICRTGDEGCNCFLNATCSGALVCVSERCVAMGGGATGAMAGTNGESSGTTATGGSSSGSSSSATGTGDTGSTASTGATDSTTTNGSGSTTGTTASSGATSASGGSTSGSTSASGGSTTSTSASGGSTTSTSASGGSTTSTSASGGSTSGSTSASGGSTTSTSASDGSTGIPPADPRVIDDFGTCDDIIPSVAGRSGKWYHFASDSVGLEYGFGDPGPDWEDHTCAAWASGGASGTTSATGDYAGIGVILASGDPYDLSAYAGIRITIENGESLYFFAKTYDGGYYGAPIPSAVGEQVRSIYFSSLLPSDSTPATSIYDPTQTIELQITAVYPLDGFGFAVHRVDLF